MTTLGKVLLLLNVLAAAAVAYFATDNWARRQSLNATGLRYALTLRGLPTEPQAGQPAALTSAPADDASVAVRLPTGTGRFTEDVPFRILKEHFADADGKAPFPFGDKLPPLSVIGELKRVDEAVAKFLGRPTDRAQRAAWDPTAAQVDQGLAWVCGRLDRATGSYAPGLLGYLAEGYGERQVVKKLLDFPGTDPRGEAAERKTSYLKALAMLDKRFDAVLNAPAPGGPDPEVANAQRAVIAAEQVADAARRNEDAEVRNFKAQPDDAALAEKVRLAGKTTEEAREKLTAATDAFEAALAGTGQAAARDDGDRRRRAVLLLSHLDHATPDASWQKRVMLLFGQPEYVRSQADRVERLAGYPLLIDDERHAKDAAFLAEYDRLKQAAKDRDWFLEQQKYLLAQVAKQVEDAKQLHADRKKYLDERAAIAAGLTAQVKALAAEQELVEGELFALQVRVGRLLRENFELEDRLISAERQALPPGGR